jgi:Fe/S biogenesis protein NfuA
MITITEAAAKKIAELVTKNEKPVKGLRIGARSESPLKVDYKLAFISEEQIEESDERVPFEGFEVFIDSDSLTLLEEATVEYVDGLMGSGFKIERPRGIPTHLHGDIAQRVHEVIENEINPGVASHGGTVSLMDVKNNTVYVQLGGGCQGCGQASVTLKDGVVRMIKEAVPEVDEVIDVTDHGAGDNPYY